MALFNRGDFELHSGERSDFLINCAALTDADLAALAEQIAQRVGPFTNVLGVPMGGDAIAAVLRRHASDADEVGRIALIVDAVHPTGASMEDARAVFTNKLHEWTVKGAVIFARGPCPDWIVPLFTMAPSGAERG